MTRRDDVIRYDTAWHREAQPLVPWFKSYAARRYGAVAGAGIGGAGVAAAAIGDAEEAWEILRTNVYNYAGCGSFGGYHDGSGVEWKPFGAPPVCTLPDPKNVSKAWELLVKVGATIDPVTYATLNYDIVNTGREVLAQLITLFEATLTTAAANHDKKTAMDTGNVLLAAYGHERYLSFALFSLEDVYGEGRGGRWGVEVASRPKDRNTFLFFSQAIFQIYVGYIVGIILTDTRRDDAPQSASGVEVALYSVEFMLTCAIPMNSYYEGTRIWMRWWGAILTS